MTAPKRHADLTASERRLAQAVGQAIRTRRLALKLDQQAFAERAYTHRCHHNRIECGHVLPSLPKLGVICEALGTQVSTLMGEVEAIIRQARPAQGRAA